MLSENQNTITVRYEEYKYRLSFDKDGVNNLKKRVAIISEKNNLLLL